MKLTEVVDRFEKEEAVKPTQAWGLTVKRVRATKRQFIVLMCLIDKRCGIVT